jgi:hypothetical protein
MWIREFALVEIGDDAVGEGCEEAVLLAGRIDEKNFAELCFEDSILSVR